MPQSIFTGPEWPSDHSWRCFVVIGQKAMKPRMKFLPMSFSRMPTIALITLKPDRNFLNNCVTAPFIVLGTYSTWVLSLCKLSSEWPIILLYDCAWFRRVSQGMAAGSTVTDQSTSSPSLDGVILPWAHRGVQCVVACLLIRLPSNRKLQDSSVVLMNILLIMFQI